MRKALFLLLCLVLPMAWAAPDATALANEVRSRQDWAGDLDKCPINLFTATGRQSYSSAVHEQCTEPASQGTCLAACKSGKGEHCYWLALALQTSASDERSAEILFQRSCKLGIASGCTNRAAAMMAGIAEASEAKNSCPARTFERTCSAGDAWGCAMYGLILDRDKSDPRNKDRAREALKKACQYGYDDPACSSSDWLRKKLR